MKVIKTQGNSVLVEWLDDDGRYQRGYLPRTLVDEEMDTAVLTTAIPYGAEWAELIPFQVTPEQLQQELRKKGIWTAEDVLENPQVVAGAINAVIGIGMTQVIRAAKTIQQRRKS